MDTNAPAPKPDMLEQLKRTLERYSNGDDLARRFANAERDSTLVLASAVVAVVAELRDIHNVLHEINQHAGALLTLAQADDSYTVSGEEVKW